LVKNIPIRFAIIQDNSNGAISNSRDTTDNLGRASTIYTSTDVTTAKDGVIIQAEVENRSTYEGAGIPCTSSDLCTTVAITVAQADLFVRLGTGHLMEEVDITRYRKPYNVLVTDSAGNASANVEVKVTLIPSYYYKGKRHLDPGDDGIEGTSDDKAPWTARPDATCQNEDTLIPGPDTELNGIIDTGEDINNNGQLEPGNVASVYGTVVTDETGFATIYVNYAKEYASWTLVRLKASAQVAGSEGADEVEFVLPVLLADVNSKDVEPPGYVSPFGSASVCTVPN